MPATLVSAASGTINDSGLSDGIVTAMNAALSAVLAKTLDTFQVSIANFNRVLGSEINVVVGYKATGATITSPYKVNAFRAGSLTALVAAVQAWITANPTFWVGPMRVVYAPSDSVASTTPSVAVVLYNESASDGASNWSPLG